MQGEEGSEEKGEAGGRRCRHNLAGGQRSAASFPAAPNAAERT